MVESIIRRTLKSIPEVADSVFEIRRDIATKLIVVTGLLYLTWHLFFTLFNPVQSLWDVWAISLIVFVCFPLAFYLIPRHYTASQIVWHVAALLAVGIAAANFKDARMYYLLVLLPFTAMITHGWAASLVVETALGGVCWVLVTQLTPFPNVTLNTGMTIACLGFAMGLVGWVISDTMLTIGEWYVSSYMRAQNSMEEIRVQRIQLAQVIKNLDQAYYRLQRTNADLVAAWKAASEAERLKTEFATHISHELRTPLNLIAGFSEMMLTLPENYGEAQLPGPYRRDMNTIYRSVTHLLDLVDDVIDLARLDAGRLSITREEVVAADLVQEAAAMVRSYIEAKGLKFIIDIQPGLPFLFLDRLRIRQVLLNLLVNASRFTERGSIHLSAHWQQDVEAVRFSVSDTGRGIRPDELQTLFTDFNPGEKPTDGGVPWHSGSGLGLPISKKFIDLHHGKMGAYSELGKGTTLWFELPLVEKETLIELKQDKGEVEGPIFLSSRDVAKPEEQRLVVLLHPDRRLPAYLQRHLPGWRVRGVKTVERIQAIADEEPVSAVIMDSNEPIPELSMNLPVVLCPLPSDRRLAQGLGVQGFLSKPVTREDIIDAIDRLSVPVRRVLIVDDDADMVNLIKRMLIHRVHPQDCLEAFNGVDALSILHNDSVDVVLLDLMMPEMEGRELLSILRDDPKLCRLPVLVISALEEPASELVGALQVYPTSDYAPSQMLGLVKKILDTLSVD